MLHCYYGRRPLNLHRIVEQELANFPGYLFDCDTQPDPDWRQYLDVLYPTEENYERIKNMAVLEALGNAGDEPHIIRPIWHYVFFNSDNGRKRFIEWSKDNGFEQADRVRSDSPGNLQPGMVCVVRSHSTRPDDVNNYVLEVLVQPSNLAESTMVGKPALKNANVDDRGCGIQKVASLIARRVVTKVFC